MTNPLIWLAGANRDILARAPGERVKQEALGGVVLTTSGLAALSMGFALHMALHLAVPVAVLLALLWGLAIANFDRWLLTATARQDRAWKNVGLALPRFVLAAIVGLVVSTPLTLQVFSAEIDDELTVMQAESQAAFTAQLAADPRYRQLPEQRGEIVRLESDIATPLSDAAVLTDPAVADLRAQLDKARADYQVAEQAVICEHEGTCGSNRVGAGPAYREKVQRRDQKAADVQDLSVALARTMGEVRSRLQQALTERHANEAGHLADLRDTVASTEAAMAAEKARNVAANRSGDGLLARLDALDRITSTDEALGRAHLALFLFFTVIECLPVVLKLLFVLARPSLYEQLTILDEEARLSASQVAASVEVDAEAMRAQVDLAAEQRALRQQHEARRRVTQAAIEAQESLAREALARWRDEHELVLDLGTSASFEPEDPAPAATEPREPREPGEPAVAPGVRAVPVEPLRPVARLAAAMRRVIPARVRPRWVGMAAAALSTMGLSRPRG